MRARALVACLCLGLATAAGARTLEEVQAQQQITICANPDALPYAKRSGPTQGFQVELGRAIARAMGLGFDVKWIIPSYRARVVDCDLQLDFIVQALQPGSNRRLTRPYARGGIALAVGANQAGLTDFRQVVPGRVIGVMINSLASVLLQQRGWSTSTYAFEDDMLEDLEKGAIAGAAISTYSIQYHLKTHPDSPLRFLPAYEGEPELEWTLAISVRRGDERMVEALNTVLARLMGDGTLAAIYGGYGITYRQP